MTLIKIFKCVAGTALVGTLSLSVFASEEDEKYLKDFVEKKELSCANENTRVGLYLLRNTAFPLLRGMVIERVRFFREEFTSAP